MLDIEQLRKSVCFWATQPSNPSLEDSRRYNGYFKKTFPSIPKILVDSVYDVGKYVSVGDRKRILLKSFSKSRPICINSSERVLDKKRECEKKINCVFESAMKTYPTSEFVKFVGGWIDMNLPDELKKLTYKDVGISSDTRLVDNIYVSNEDSEISPFVQVLIPYYEYQTTGFEYLIRDFLNISYRYGYLYHSMDVVDVRKQPFSGKNIVVYEVTFEARYKELNTLFAEKIFRVIPTNSLENIKCGGLTPRCKPNESKYPERIYFFNTAFESMRVRYGIDRFPEGFCILSIDSDRLKSDSLFKSGDMKFYIDPIFVSKYHNDLIDAKMFFTCSNVRPELIDDDVVEYVPIVENPRRKEDFRVVHRKFR